MDTHTTTIDAAGRIIIPAAQRKALQLKAGDKINLWVEGGSLKLTPLRQGIRELQDYLAAIIPKGVSLADELIADRRAEANSEQDDAQ